MIGKTISHYKILEQPLKILDEIFEGINIVVWENDIDLKLKNIMVANFYRFLTPLGVSCL